MRHDLNKEHNGVSEELYAIGGEITYRNDKIDELNAQLWRVFIKLCQHLIISAPNLIVHRKIFVAGKLSTPNYA